MEVQQAEHVDAARFLQTIDHFEQFGRRQSELGRLAAGLFPASRTFRIEFDADADNGRVAFRGVGDAQHMIEFAQLLDDDDHAFARLRAGKSHFDKLFVLESI